MNTRRPVNSLLAGLILGLLAIGLNSVPSAPGWLGSVLVIAGLAGFVFLFGRAHNNQLTFGELFGYGFRVTIALTLVYIIYIGAMAYIHPEMKAEAIATAKADYEKQKNVTPNDVEKLVSTMDKYFWVGMVGSSMLVMMIMGAAGSLLGASITKRVPKTRGAQPDRLDQLKP